MSPAGWWAALVGCGSPDVPAPPDLHRPAPDELPAITAPSDLDRDGFAGDVDCWPHDPARYPGGPEQCNGLDDDCDGQPDPEWDQDLDGDGSPWCTDCWDTESSFFPGAEDPYGDDLDQNCDGTDGVGERVSGAVFEGESDWHVAGWWLASSDVDGDGCAELAMGAPSYPLLPSQEYGQVTVASGCQWPEPALTDRIWRSESFYGDRVEMSGTTLLTLDGGYWVGRGRAELLDARTFGQEAEPLLEVKGSLTYFQVDDVTLLGPDWLLIGRADWAYGWPAEFRMVSTARRGFIDFELDDPSTWDYELTSDHAGGRVAHVGDRDGDGAVDLAVSLGGYATFFFPELTSGHVADAPEQWDHGGAESTGDILHGAADLDGDGRDDAWIASTIAPGATDAPYSGRVYLAPARGPGVHLVEETAPAEIRGETVMDWTGFSTATGDLDGDGQVDLVVGAGGNFQLARHPGKVLAYLGPLSGVYTVAEADGLWVGEALDDHAGNAVEVGDFDGSGLADIAIGALFADGAQGENAGRVYVLLDPLAP